ncbi:DUF3192 domain-containing protein [Psychrosphaera sp. B3R10]|uniref:DUF3192 domain-containing protein n=1 Tax=unclassified Psychrosphaera TaxID=2641570 RepID=UPI001C095945|nr:MULTISPECIES: DUF3192 domain-containing protein [unclassified Psychrosphaera]MBU2884001.1 DUF3192 domain-containing protein [Psychrosphaera sp. I2R16]MBU2988131.1 DUF3192 domain-containing protein [Psychrosphaera sp. B3R10]MDO6718340.1 DUF3192 domain-containing protein [Psychrosphaera sp. 1_MG-2023]
MNRTFKMALIAIPLTFSLTGCIIVSTDEGREADWIGSSDRTSSWKKEQRINKQKIADLKVGATYSNVRELMGTPEFNEAFKSEGKEVQVIFYRTNHQHSDGETTKDECTPLIFVDGLLTSWGQKAYHKL